MSNDQQARLTHVNASGEARMVDVSDKAVTVREARAAGFVAMARETLEVLRSGSLPKGDVLAVARVAGIMAAKRTSDLIPLCHQLPLSGVEVLFDLEVGDGVGIKTVARTRSSTGVEMEALTAACISALTIYDMCKAIDRDMVIRDVRLTFKSGGRSGTYERSAG